MDLQKNRHSVRESCGLQVTFHVKKKLAQKICHVEVRFMLNSAGWLSNHSRSLPAFTEKFSKTSSNSGHSRRSFVSFQQDKSEVHELLLPFPFKVNKQVIKQERS